MDNYFLLFLGICLASVVAYRFYKPKTKPEVFFEQGEFVTLNSKVTSNVVLADVQKLRKTDIVKIQLAGSCLSLFNKSDHAIDIWVHCDLADKMFSQAAAIFPHAEKIVIES